MGSNLLIIIKYEVELRLLTKNILDKLSNKYNITISLTYFDDNTISDLNNEFDKITFIKREKITSSVIEKTKRYFEKIKYYFHHSNHSTSCQQKILYDLITVGGNLKIAGFANNIIKISYDYKIINWAYKYLLKIIRKVIKYEYKIDSTNNIKRGNFKYIIFMEPGGIENKNIANSYLDNKGKIINVARNIDFTGCKGPPTVKSRYFITFSKFTKREIKKFYGNHVKIFNFSHPYTNNDKTLLQKKILFAETDNSYSKKEYDYINDIYDTFIHNKKFKLTIKKINKLNDFNFRSMDKKLYNFDNTYRMHIINRNSSTHLGIKYISKNGFADYLNDYDIVISSCSTICYEAYMCNIDTFFIAYDHLNWVYERDHFKYLVNELNLPRCSNKNELKIFFDEKYNN
mgnify:CR=1 FL=1